MAVDHDASPPPETAGAVLEAIFASAPVGLALLDGEGRFTRVSDELARLHGVTVADHLGRRPRDFLGALGARLSDAAGEALASDRAVDLVLAPAGGRERHLAAKLFAVRAVDGEPLGVAVDVREVAASRDADADRTHLLKDALESRAQAEAAQLRAEDAREQAEDARRRMAFLARAGARMASSLDFETTLRDVAQSAVPTIADWCAIVVSDPAGEVQTTTVAHADPTRRRWAESVLAQWPPDASPITESARAGRPVLFESVDDELVRRLARDDGHAEALRGFGARSLMVVALRSPSRSFGALWLAYADSGRRYDESDVALARALAGRAALHIENARLYTERTHIAETLQRSLLPRTLPQIPGVELAASYRASGELNEVGGDFYDAFTAQPGVWITDHSSVSSSSVASQAGHRQNRIPACSGTRRVASTCASLNRAMALGLDQKSSTQTFGRRNPAKGSRTPGGGAAAARATAASARTAACRRVNVMGSVPSLDLWYVGNAGRDQSASGRRSKVMSRRPGVS